MYLLSSITVLESENSSYWASLFSLGLDLWTRIASSNNLA